MSNQPLETIRVGRIKATIWENINETNGGVFHSLTFARNYRDPNTDQWQEASTFSVDDLPRINAASNKAFDRIYERQQELQDPQPEKSQAEELPLKEEPKKTPRKRANSKSHAETITEERKTAAASKSK